jgi:exodeoxyribonuclease V gamma subunit
VVVSGLLEYLDKAFVAPGVVRKHCLQAFGATYFTPGTGLFSYSKDNALAARALWAGSREGEGWPALIGEPDEQWSTADPERLLDFYRGPARFFLRYRLGISLPREEGAVLDREPFTLSGLERYSLQQRILHDRLAGRGVESDLARLRAEGLLPHGVAGELALKGLAREVEGFLPLIEKAMTGRKLEKTPVAVSVDGFTLTGFVDSLSGAGFLSFRYAQAAPQDLLRAWISLLLLQSASPCEGATAVHIHKEGVITLRPPSNPPAVLQGLVDVYRQGLMRPVHFFPRSSHAYADSLRKYGSDERAMEDALKKWEGSFRERSEAGDAAAHLCFSRTDPLDDEFRALSLTVFGPVLDAMEGA